MVSSVQQLCPSNFRLNFVPRLVVDRSRDQVWQVQFPKPRISAIRQPRKVRSFGQHRLKNRLLSYQAKTYAQPLFTSELPPHANIRRRRRAVELVRPGA